MEALHSITFLLMPPDVKMKSNAFLPLVKQPLPKVRL